MRNLVSALMAMILPCMLPSVAVAQHLEYLGDFNENLDENATRISGATLVGVQRGGDRIRDVELLAYLPEDWDETELCLRVTTSNGRYEAINSYRLSLDGDPTYVDRYVPISFPTGHADYLVEQGAHRVAAYLSGGPCGEAGHPMTLVVWGETPNGPLELLVNTYGADETFIYRDGANEAMDCRRVPGQGLSAFDTLCVMSEPPWGRQTSIEIVRYFNNIPTEPDIFVLNLPDR